MKNMKKVLIIAMTACFLFLGTVTAISAKDVQEGKKRNRRRYNGYLRLSEIVP